MAKGFYTQLPFVLVKAKENKRGDWSVFLEASNEGVDQEGEKMLRKALEEQKDYFLDHGVLSLDHQHKLTNDPKYIIGEPSDVRFTSDNKTLVKGKLYKENPLAQGLWKNLLSGSTRFGASVGGYVLAKGAANDIEKVIWDEVAVTNHPVLDSTLGHVSVIPFQEFTKSLSHLDSSIGSELGQPLQEQVRVNSLLNQAGDPLNAHTLNNTILDDFINGEQVGMELHSAHEATDLFMNMWVSVMMNEIKTHNDLVTWMLKRGYSYPFAEYTANYVAMNLPKVLATLSIPTKDRERVA